MRHAFYWLCLSASIVFEVTGTCIMKLSQDTPWTAAGMAAMYLLLGLSYYFLARAVVKLPIGVAYAFWEGFGLLLISLAGVFILNEQITPTRALALCMVLAGTMLVNHGTESPEQAPAEGELP